MTGAPVVLSGDKSLEDAARVMRDHDIGDVLVSRDGTLAGLVTDRDIVVRGLAEGRATATLDDICTRQLIAVDPEADLTAAAQIMEAHAIRRLPVLEDGEPVGMVSLGDLAQAADPKSALAGISAAPPNN
jgi:CBS domain-containing protein